MSEGYVKEVINDVSGLAPMKYLVVDIERTMGRYKILFIDLPLTVRGVMDGVNTTKSWVWVCLDRWPGSSGYAFARGDGFLSVDYIMEKLNIRNIPDGEEITKIIAEELGRLLFNDYLP